MIDILWSNLVRKSGLWSNIFGQVLIFDEKFCEKVAIWSKKVAICPLLKMDLATKNAVFMRVCGQFGQKPTFFSYLI